jgi:hypothetical protein
MMVSLLISNPNINLELNSGANNLLEWEKDCIVFKTFKRWLV